MPTLRHGYSGAEVAIEILRIAEEFELHKDIGAIVVDNASAMDNAYRQFESLLLDKHGVV